MDVWKYEEYLEAVSLIGGRDHKAVFFAEILIVVLKERPCKSRHEYVELNVCILDSILISVCSPSLAKLTIIYCISCPFYIW